VLRAEGAEVEYRLLQHLKPVIENNRAVRLPIREYADDEPLNTLCAPPPAKV
jgi:hypothetical protein